jgi:4-hydroxybenzoate polyprenyltransferase
MSSSPRRMRRSNLIREYLSLALKVSRVRFWFYLAGPFTVGYVWGAQRFLDLWNLEFFSFLFYFMLPANILLYGVNDYWDYDTDRLNPKKSGKEHLIRDEEKGRLVVILGVSFALSVLLMILQCDLVERLILASFLFLSCFYSAKPLRFKATPILDFSSNILYLLPGILAFYQVIGHLPSLWVILAAFLHSSAMHIFSAIPDIHWDTRVGIRTTAVLMGERASMTLCFIFWVLFSGIVIIIGGFSLISFISLIYPLMIVYLWARRMKPSSTYWAYPYINTGLGGLLFFLGAFRIPFV